MQQDSTTDVQTRREWTRPELNRLDAGRAELAGGLGGDTESEAS